MIPILDKNAVRVITLNITPEQAEYVAGINSIVQDVKENHLDIDINEGTDDVIFVQKIMAFCDKFRNLHWSAVNHAYHKVLDEFCEELEEYKDEIAENIQSIIGQFTGTQFTKLELPISDNPLEVINELKQCVVNWFELHKDDMEYEGCRNASSGFIQEIHKYIYLFRLCKHDVNESFNYKSINESVKSHLLAKLIKEHGGLVSDDEISKKLLEYPYNKLTKFFSYNTTKSISSKWDAVVPFSDITDKMVKYGKLFKNCDDCVNAIQKSNNKVNPNTAIIVYFKDDNILVLPIVKASNSDELVKKAYNRSSNKDN